MALIQSNKTTESYGASSKNFITLQNLEGVDKKAVVTELAQECINEIDSAHLGWGYRTRKFLATTCSYASALVAPIFAVSGLIWYNFTKILNINISQWAAGSATIGGALAADVAVGKIFGIRPITACLITAYDAYRHGAKALSTEIKKSYEDHEMAMKDLAAKSRKILIHELKTTYAALAMDLRNHTPNDISKFSTQIPVIEKSLSQLGLSRRETVDILLPLKDTIKILPHCKLA